MKQNLVRSLLNSGLYFPLQYYFNPKSLINEVIRKDLPFFKKIIKPCNLIFDIGANSGYKSATFSFLAKKIIAVEPQPDCIKYIRSLSKWKRNIKIEPVAVSDTNGTVELFISSENTLSSISSEFINEMQKTRFTNSIWNKTIRVNAVTLQTLFKKHGTPDFIKIDVEGSESLVIRGMKVPVKLISFEFSTEVIHVAEECIASLLALDKTYKFNYTTFDNYHQMALDIFIDGDKFIKEILPKFKATIMGGDIYASLK